MRSVYGWTDSTVVLHWITGQGSYKQFVANRVLNQIKATAYVKWRYTGTEQRHHVLRTLKIWLKGPYWLSNLEMWLAVVLTKPSK